MWRKLRGFARCISKLNGRTARHVNESSSQIEFTIYLPSKQIRFVSIRTAVLSKLSPATYCEHVDDLQELEFMEKGKVYVKGLLEK